jgi:hypothetical protein
MFRRAATWPMVPLRIVACSVDPRDHLAYLSRGLLDVRDVEAVFCGESREGLGP